MADVKSRIQLLVENFADLGIKDDNPRIQSSLPPAVKGQLRCFLAVTVDQIKWQVDNHPRDIQVCLQWWGEAGDGTVFWPFPERKKSNSRTSGNTVLYPICSGPKQFASYLKDMNILVLDVLHSKSLKAFGKVEIHDIVKLNGANPIDKWYPVSSRSVQPVVFAKLHVLLKLEAVNVVGQDLSTFVPEIDNDFNHFVDNEINSGNDERQVIEEKSDTKEPGDLKENEDVTEDDVIVSLIKRGKTLRNSIMESGANVETNTETVYKHVDRNEEEHLERSSSGSLFREILGFEEAEDTVFLENTEISLPFDVVARSTDDDDDTRSSDRGTESDDAIYDETLLQDLFYMNKDDSAAVVPMLNEPGKFDDVDDDTKERDTKHVLDKEQVEKDPLSERNQISELGAASVEEEKESFPEKIGVNNNRDHIFSAEKRVHSPDNTQSKDVLSFLGVNKLTALGRVTATRIHINKLNILNDSITHDKRTYFIEYEFPVAADHCEGGRQNDVGLEITRVATNRTTSQSILFNHHSVFPVHFNLPVVRFWCECELNINIFKRESGQKSPVKIGRGKICLRNVLTSDRLQYEGLVQIKVYSKQDGLSNQSSSTSSSKESPLLGELEIKINLMSNGKDLDYFSPTKNQENVPSELFSDVGNKKDLSSGVKGAERVLTEQIPQQAHVNKKEKGKLVPLRTLLWVSEGRNIVRDGHGAVVSVPGSMTRSNYYLISRMFWSSDITRSSVSWGQNDPKFNFRQIFPVLLSSALLDRMHNNFLTLEVWSKSGGTQEDGLVGIAKIPLQQLYLSYKEEQTAKALLKSKFPVVGVDCWVNIGNPFKGSSHGELHVLLAMGSENQINKLLDIKLCSNQHDYFQPKDRLGSDPNTSPKYSGEPNIEHWFEISVQNVKKLSAFEATSLGETDCFVQYNFPYQKPDVNADTSVGLSEDLPGLQSHRTATTACVPDTNFNDVARYRIVLPPSLPVQRYLLAAYHGSWSGSGMSAVVTFELWKRYYYPNIRDKLVAKSSLPLSKLCGMVTMHKPGETNTQSFSLPLTTLSNSVESWKSEPGGVLDVTIKYRQSKLTNPNIHQFKENSAGVNQQVCLAIEIVRACGLKCALAEQAKKDSSLTYASEVGGNPFVRIKLPFNIKMSERSTRTIAKTFTPEFGYRMEFILPLVLKHNLIGRDSQEFSGTLAECLEFGEVVFEIWHQRPRENYENLGEEIPMGQNFYQRQLPPTSDILLGVVKIPLQQLLFSHTGVRGWFPLSLSTMGWSNEDDARNILSKTVGGLELIINFSENTAREKIIESGRAVGWCPPLWYELEDGQWLNHTEDNGIMNVGQGLGFLVNIKKVWIPRAVVTAEQARKGVKGTKQIGCYIRYKFYDSKAVFSPICGVQKVKESDSILCDLKHRHSFIVKTTSPFIWYIREERLEIQVWLTTRQHGEKSALPHKRDKLVGSAFVVLFPLLDGNKSFSQISGLYPLFRSSAIDLRGAGLHVQLVLRKPIESQQALGDEVDEDIVSTETSESVLLEKESFTIVSSDEADEQKEAGKYMKKPEEISSAEDDNDIITAHVVIERALHIPLVRTDENKSVQPNVYVTYQPRPQVKVIKTKTICLSSSPVWDHEKIVKFNKFKIGKQVLTFKVWHNQRDSGQSTADEDLLLGLASVDLSPLASGLRQVIGWYNIVDFSGQCQGQVKVGVVPLLSVSPERLLLRPVNAHLSTTSTSDVFPGRTDGIPPRKPSGITSDIAASSPPQEAADSTKSFLLRQLRQNLNDLDVIKDKLSQRLMADNGMLSSCMKKKSSGFLKNIDMSDKCVEPVKTFPVTNRLACLTSVNNHDEPINTLVSFAHNQTTMKPSRHCMEGEDQQLSPVHQIDVSRSDSPVRRTNSQRCDSNNDSENEWKEFDHSRFSDGHDYCKNIKELNSDANYGINDNYVEEENEVGLGYRDDDHDDYQNHDDEDIHDDNDDNGNDNRNHGGDDDNEDDHDDDIHGVDDDNDDNDNDDENHGNDDDDNGNDCISESVLDPKQYINDTINDHISGYNQNEDLSADEDIGSSDVVSEPRQKTGGFDVSREDIEHINDSNLDDSGDESLDSFFDCTALKKKSEPKQLVNVTYDTLDPSVTPELVVSRANLSKLRNVLNERTKEDKLEQQTENNRPLLSSDKLSTVETQENKKDRGRRNELILDEFKMTEAHETDQNFVAKETFHEQNEASTITRLKKALIPNFFMPSKDLEQSMRSLRLAATFSRERPRSDESNGPREQKQDGENQETSQRKNLAKSFINWRKIQEIRDTGEIPLTSVETSRLSRIFSSNYVTRK